MYTLSCTKNHSYCYNCLKNYINSSLQNGNTMILCPESYHCHSYLKEKNIRDILSTKSYLQYQEFKLLRMSIICPFCGAQQNRCDSKNNPQICCHQCMNIYCLYHSNAHPATITCAEYENNLREIDQSSYRLIRNTSQLCPSCQIPTTKISGCNSMKCSICQKVRSLHFLDHFSRDGSTH